jgi:hypothetical protein
MGSMRAAHPARANPIHHRHAEALTVDLEEHVPFHRIECL